MVFFISGGSSSQEEACKLDLIEEILTDRLQNMEDLKMTVTQNHPA